ncbi:MAG: hypothetical protein LUH10_07620 [Tannerellaceae bacterium]|nr:hypothetical protein [Tannerellaceae bacterium]
MKKYLPSIIGVCLTFGFFFLFTFLNDDFKQNQHPLSKESLEHTAFNYSLNINHTGMIIDDIALNYGLLSTFLYERKKPVLIFRIIESNCDLCYNHEMDIIKEYYGDTFMEDNIMIFGSFTYDRNLNMLLKRRKLNIVSENIPYMEENPLDELNFPYYFILNPDMKISNIYIPDKTFPDLTIEYLESIKRLLM